jgi:hypothetical protein
MKIQRLSLCLAGVMAVCAWTGYGAGEAYYIVKVQDMAKEVSTTVMSATEFKALEKTIQQEKQYFSAAVTAAAKEWRENEANKGIPFPGGRVIPRKIMPGSSERFSSSDKAQEKLTAIETLESKRLEREALKGKTGKNAAKTREEIARDSKKESELMAAQELIQNKLTEIIEAKAAGAPAAGAKGADQPAVKPQQAADAVKRAL